MGDGIHGTPEYSEGGSVYFINGNNLFDGKILIKPNTKRVSKEEAVKHSRLLNESTVLVSINGTIGNIAFYSGENIILGKSACYFNLLNGIEKKYIMIVLQTDYFLEYAKRVATGSTIKNVPLSGMRNFLIPIPPEDEQQVIIDKLLSLKLLIEKFNVEQLQLDKLNAELRPVLRKSILQEAIQGKLVPQITEEGTAQDLLEQIQQEKQKLVKEGKFKKSALTDSVIYKGDDNKYFEKNGKIEKDITNEIPFEIPDTWAWSRLSNLVVLISGRDLEQSQYNSVSNGIPYMTGASNFRNGNLIKNRWTETPIVISILGDLLITCKGTIGEMSFNTIGDIHIARQIMALRSSFVNLKYIQYYLSANIQELQKQANSMIPGISRDTLLNALVPLPPLIEQARIVSKIKQLASIMRG